MKGARRSIRTRILAAFILSLAALIGALIYGIVQLRSIGADLSAIDSVYLPLAEVTVELESVIRQMDRDHDRFARESPRPVTGHRSNAGLYRASLTESVRRGRATLALADDRFFDAPDRIALETAGIAFTELEHRGIAYEELMADWVNASQVGNTGESTRLLAELDRARSQLAASAARLSALVEGRIQNLSEQTASAQNRAFVVSGTLAVLAVILAAMMAAFALLSLRPIARLTEQVQRLAAGEMVGRVELPTSDEMGILAQEFNAMAEAVAERDRRLSDRAAALDRLSLRLRQVLDTIRVGIVVVEDGRVEMTNPAATQIWQVEVGADLVSPLATLDAGPRIAIPMGERLLNVDVVPFGARGKLIVGEDVTDRIRDQARLARSERLAMVGQMLAQITHEVRNPLNAMSLNAELLAEEIDDSESQAILATITGEIQRLEQLTARYLHLSRRREPEWVTLDPRHIVDEVLRLEDEGLRRAGVATEVRGDHGQVVELDADALHRALHNVIRNAVEADAHSIEVEVLTGTEHVTVRVRDDGPGMTLDQITRIFEPFYTTKARGTGLGLAISRQDLEEIGGSLACESALGEGSTFILTVPTTVHKSMHQVDTQTPR